MRKPDHAESHSTKTFLSYQKKAYVINKKIFNIESFE